MKIAKWLFLAACAVLCAACAKNDPLAYVEADADKVYYLDNTKELNSDMWDALIKGDLKWRFTNDDYELFGVNMKKNPAKMAMWITYKHRKNDYGIYEKKSQKMVIVFKEMEAESFLDDVKDYWEEDNKKDSFVTQEAAEEKIDGKKALVLKVISKSFTYDGYGGSKEKEEKIQATIIASDKHVVQIFFDDEEPDSVLKPEKACEMVKDFDRDAISIRGESKAWCELQEEDMEEDMEKRQKMATPKEKKEEYEYEKLNVGAKITHVYLKGDEVVTKTTQSIE